MNTMLSLLLSLTAVGEPQPAPRDTLAPELRGEPIALLPRGVTSFGAEALDGWLYVFGGYHGEPHRYSREGQSDEFLRMNLRDPRAFELLDGGVAIQGAPLAAWKGRLVRAGGMVARNARGEKADLQSSADVALYDPAKRAWEALPPLPTPRSSHDIEVVGDQLVVLGGWTLAGSSKGKFCTEASVLNLANVAEGWKQSPAPFQRRALSLARVGERILAIGGMDSDGELQASVDIFDPTTSTWTSAPEFPGAPFGVAACATEGAVLAAGKDGVLYRLDGEASAWQHAGKLAFPRFFHQLVAGDRGQVFVLGGIDDMRPDGRVRHVERLDPKRPDVPVVTTFEVPAPFPAKNRQGAFLRDNVLMLFGGNRSLRQHDFQAEDFRSEAFALDLATMQWKQRAAFPEGRQTISSALASDDALGFTVGGFGFADGKALARGSSFRYTFESDAWEAAPELALPKPRTQFALLQDKGALWVFGGLDYDPSRGDEAFLHPTEVLRAELGAAPAFVDSGVRLTMPRRACASATLGRRAYLVGGMREEFDVVGDCESFDFEQRTFAPMAAPRRARVSAELIALGDKLYLCGGSSSGADGKLTPDRSIEVYDPKSDSWSVLLEELPIVMTHMRAFGLRDQLLLVSSHVDGPPTTRIALVAP